MLATATPVATAIAQVRPAPKARACCRSLVKAALRQTRSAASAARSRVQSIVVAEAQGRVTADGAQKIQAGASAATSLPDVTKRSSISVLGNSHSKKKRQARRLPSMKLRSV